jgi:hypothetical protein
MFTVNESLMLQELRSLDHVQLLRTAVLIGLAVCCAGCPREATQPAATPKTDSEVEAVAVPEADPVADDFAPEPGFRLLTLADFEPFPADATTWSERGGILVCSGKPKGYAHTREQFANFTLRCEYRFVPSAPAPDAEAANKFNTGFMIYVQEPHKVWPASLEVQGRFDEMASIKSNGGAAALVTTDDQAGRESVRLPVGNWNAVEIVSRDGALSAALNGVVIATSQPGKLKSGMLGLQAEGFEVQFKHLRVQAEK